MRVNEMRGKRTSHTAIFMKFKSIYKKDKEALYCFVEGKYDDKYYINRIKGRTKFKPIFLQCSGKSKVIAFRDYISEKEEYNSSKKAYFVDRDFDESVTAERPDIYETPGYSIENFYTTEDVLENIMMSYFKLYKDDDNYYVLMEKFKFLQNDFHDKILELNTWIYCQRKLEKEMKEVRKLSLDSVAYKNLYKVGLDTICKKYDVNELDEMFPDAYTIEEDIFKGTMVMLKDSNRQEVFRGKFEFNFFCEFLKLIITDYNCCLKSKSRYFEKNESTEKVSLNISDHEESMIDLFSSCAETHSCLERYIDNLIKIYKEVV